MYQGRSVSDVTKKNRGGLEVVRGKDGAREKRRRKGEEKGEKARR